MSNLKFKDQEKAEKIISLFSVLSKDDKERVLGELTKGLSKNDGNIMSIKL